MNAGTILLVGVLHCSSAAPTRSIVPKYSNAWAGVRGVNYVPSYSRNPVQTWMDYDAETVDRELGYAQNLGFNAARMFLHMFPWMNNKTKFLSNFDHFVAACASKGIKPLVVLFDDDFFDAPGVTSFTDVNDWLKTGAFKSSKWMANPGVTLLTADSVTNWTVCTEFLEDVVSGPRANDTRLLGYDIMNEPHRPGLSPFITHVFEEVQARTAVFTTIDAYGSDTTQGEAIERGLSYHSYWEYGNHQACIPMATQVCHAQAANGRGFLSKGVAAGKPVLVSEMGQFDCYCPAAQGFQSAGVGWIAWELMLEHDQFSSFQGLVYQNGTARNSSEAACLRRLATTPVTVCPPQTITGCSPPNCTLIPDTNTSFLTYTPPSTPQQQSCWTAWAGAGPPYGTIHYCREAGASVTFTVEANRKIALVFKTGPDCGIMNVSVNNIITTIDTYAPDVSWLATHSIAAQPAFTPIQIIVTGLKNARSTNSWVQITGIEMFRPAYI